MRISVNVKPQNGAPPCSDDLDFEPDVWMKSMAVWVDENDAVVIRSTQFLGRLEGRLRFRIDPQSANEWDLEPAGLLEVDASSPELDDNVMMTGNDLEFRLPGGKLVPWKNFSLAVGPEQGLIEGLLILGTREACDLVPEFADQPELAAALIID